MSNLSENIRLLRKKHGLTQEEMADNLSISKSTVSMIENGKRYPSFELLEAIADYFNVSLSELNWKGTDHSELMNHSNIIPIRGSRFVPMLGSAACGEPIYKPGDGTEFVDAGPDVNCDFALIAEGDSMIGDRINSGDIVFIRRQDDADDGQIVAVVVDDEVMLKHISRVRDRDGQVLYTLFTSSNPRYSPIPVGGKNETRRVNILGRAVAFRSLL